MGGMFLKPRLWLQEPELKGQKRVSFKSGIQSPSQKYYNMATLQSILHFSLFPCFIINECMLDCQPWAGKHFYPQSILFAWGWYCLVYVSWNLWPVTCDYHVSLLTCQGVQLLVSTSEGKLLRVGDILLARWGRVLPASSARETLDSNQYQT